MLRKKKEESVKLNLIEYLLILVLAYSIAPIISRVVSDVLTTYFYMLIVVVLVALVFLSKGNKSVNDCILLLFPFVCWRGMTFFLPRESLILWAYGVLLDMVPLLAGYYLVNHATDKKIAFFAKYIFAVLAITVATTLIGAIIYPDAARYLATVADPNEALAVKYSWRNIGGYEFVYTLALLHPLIILAHKQGKIKRWTSLVMSILIIVLAVNSGYTIAFLLSIISCFLYLFKKNMRSKEMLILLVAVILFVILFYTVIARILIFLADLIGNDSISLRLRALAGGVEGIENSEDNRILFYEMSLNTFFKYPLFGSFVHGGHGSGGHAFTLDFLAQFGLCGLIILVFMYRAIYIRFFKPYREKEGYGYIVWMFIQTLFLSSVNTGSWFTVLAVFIPIFLRVIYKEKQ